MNESDKNTKLIKKLMDEAEINSSSGRHPDAAKGFEYIIDKCIDMKKYEDMFYFVYRSLLSWAQAGNDLKVVRLMQQVGIDSLKLSTVHAVNSSKVASSAIEMVELLYKAQENLKYLDENQSRTKMINSLISTYWELVDDPTIPIKQIKAYLEKIIYLSGEVNNHDFQLKSRQKLGDIIVEEAEFQLRNGTFDKELVYSHLLMKAALQYQEINDFQKVIQIIEDAQRIDPSLDLENFPEIQIPTLTSIQ